MSSLRNARKSQREHQERHQPLARQHLGPLEKKKDYKVRAKHQNQKKKVLKNLQKKALEKNPDEFAFHMVNSGLKSGVHYEKVQDEELAVGDVREDLTYITHRRSVENKKIQKLKAQLHLLQSEHDAPLNSHVIFVDDEKEAQRADPAQLLDTHPDLLHRSFNRLRTAQLATANPVSRDKIKETSSNTDAAYEELAKRIERENKLRIMEDKLRVRLQLMKNKETEGTAPKMVSEGTSNAAPTYKWQQERKK